MLFNLIAPGDTLQTLQPAIANAGVPLTPEMAAVLDRLAQPGQERIATKAVKTKLKHQSTLSSMVEHSRKYRSRT